MRHRWWPFFQSSKPSVVSRRRRLRPELFRPGVEALEMRLAPALPPGSLDPIIGTGGLLRSDLGAGNEINAIHLQADGRMVVAGFTTPASGSGTTTQFVVARYTTSGTLDGSFGTGGFITVANLGADAMAEDFAFQADGKIVVVGRASGTGGHDFAIVRLDQNGHLDPTFGNGGITLTDNGSNDSANAVAILADGRIVVVGSGDAQFEIARYLPNGTLDLSFNGTGKFVQTVSSTVSNQDEGETVALYGNGQILAGGGRFTDHLWRFNPNGQFDTAFGDLQGQIKNQIGGLDRIENLLIQPDGKIVAVGFTQGSSGVHAFIARYNANGTPDTSISPTGANVGAFGDTDKYFYLTRQADGKLVAAGWRSSSGKTDMLIARYDANLLLDPTFGTTGPGFTVVSFGPNGLADSSAAFGVGQTSNGDFILAGGVGQLNADPGFRFFPAAPNDDFALAYIAGDHPALPPPAFQTFQVTPTALNEGGGITMNGAFTDPNPGATFVLNIDWGDGTTASLNLNTATSFSVGHVYRNNLPTGQAAATYNVSATVVDSNNGTDSRNQLVTVNNIAPKFTSVNLSSQTLNEGDRLFLNGSFSDAGPDDSHAVFINWGDGSAVTAIPLSPGLLGFSTFHDYVNNIPIGQASSTESVQVAVSDDDGATDSVAKQITVNNVPPTLSGVKFTSPPTVGVATNLSGAITDPGPGDFHTLTIDWGDSVVDTVNLPAGQLTFNQPHTYQAGGTYTVLVSVTDDDNAAATTSIVVGVNFAPKIAAVNITPAAVNEGDTVNLSGAFTDTEPDQAYVVSVDWGDGTPVTFLQLAVGARSFSGFSHQFPNNVPIGQASSLTQVNVTVTDSAGGADSKITPVTVNNVPPKLTSVSLTPLTLNEGDTATLNGSFTDPGFGDTHTVIVDWGDGTRSTVPLAAGTLNFSIPHTYFQEIPSGAPYTVNVVLADDDNATDTSTAQVTVNNVPPTVSLGPDQTVNEGTALTLVPTVNDPGIFDTFTYQWTVTTNNGLVIPGGNGPTFTFAPPDNGVYSVNLVVTDEGGGTGTAQTVVTATNVAPRAQFAVQAKVSLGVPATFVFSNPSDPSPVDTAAGFKYSFDFHNDGTFTGPGDILNGSSPTASFNFAAKGVYVIHGRIMDKDGDSTTYTVTVSAGFDTFAVGADAGGGPDVRVYDTASQQQKFEFFAYDPRFGGGVRVAVGDVTGDGVPDVVTGPGPGGGPDIHVYDGNTGAIVAQFFAFDPRFTGGVFVAVSDINKDGVGDIIVGADAGGGPNITIFSGRNYALLASFFAFDPRFGGGVRVAAGDYNGDGVNDIIAGAGAGGGPHVQVYSGIDGTILASFFAYDANFTGGVYVAAGDTNKDGKAEIVTGPGVGGGPNVRVFSGGGAVLLENFLAYTVDAISVVRSDLLWSSGLRVGTTAGNDGIANIITAPGPGRPPLVRIFQPPNEGAIDNFFAYDSLFNSGVFVGGSG